MSKIKADRLKPDLYPEFRELTFSFISDLEKCMQCGKCVGTCPAAAVAPYNSREMIHSIKMGNIDEVIKSEELWLCFFCSSCYAVCPKDINFPFTVAMLRYASLYAGFGWEFVKKLLPYAWDYYKKGMTVQPSERNPNAVKRLAENSGTDGTMEAIRRKMGVEPSRQVSDRALAEIQFIADVSGMTRGLREMVKRGEVRPRSKDKREWQPTVKSPKGKFTGFPEEE
jgi:heterodisulfide reductase subunit C